MKDYKASKEKLGRWSGYYFPAVKEENYHMEFQVCSGFTQLVFPDEQNLQGDFVEDLPLSSVTMPKICFYM